MHGPLYVKWDIQLFFCLVVWQTVQELLVSLQSFDVFHVIVSELTK